MNRYLKALGLSLLAVFAMSAVAASGAQAAPEITGVEGESHVHTLLHATSESEANGGLQDFYYPVALGGTAHLECAHLSANATLADGSDTAVTATEIEYNGTPEGGTEASHCRAASPLGTDIVHVDMDECDHVLHVDKKLGEDEYTGTLDIECPEGHEIDIEVTGSEESTKCTIQIPEQEGLEHLIYKTPKPARRPSQSKRQSKKKSHTQPPAACSTAASATACTTTSPTKATR
jgi:hypothetical protein